MKKNGKKLTHKWQIWKEAIHVGGKVETNASHVCLCEIDLLAWVHLDKTRKKGKRQKLQKRNRSKKLGLSEISVTRMRSTARVNLRSFKSSSNCISISEFLHSIRLSFWTCCIFSWSEYHREHDAQHFWIKVLLPIKKINK